MTTRSVTDRWRNKKNEKWKKLTASSSSSKFSTSVGVDTGFGSATAVEDDGGFAKCILHFCIVAFPLPAESSTFRDDSSYCTDMPSLNIPGLE